MGEDRGRDGERERERTGERENEREREKVGDEGERYKVKLENSDIEYF